MRRVLYLLALVCFPLHAQIDNNNADSIGIVGLSNALTGITDFAYKYSPMALNVNVTGDYYIDSVLTCNFVYYDKNGDTPTDTTYQWYRANDSTSTGTAITGATNKTYTQTSADNGKWPYCSVVVTSSKNPKTSLTVYSERDSAYYNRVYLESIQPAVINQVTITLKINSGKKDTVYWGDGTYAALSGTGSNQTATSNYLTNNITYTIYVAGELNQILTFQITSEATVKGNLKQFSKLTGLTTLNLQNLATTWTGSINNLPIHLTNLQLVGLGTAISGLIQNIPGGVTVLNLIGPSAISGNTSTFITRTGITYLDLGLLTGITGISSDFRNFTNATYIRINSNRITGSLSDFTPLTKLTVLSFTGTLLNSYQHSTISSLWKDINLSGVCDLSANEIDTFLIDYYNAVKAGTCTSQLNIANTNDYRSSNSDIAYNWLTTHGKTVTFTLTSKHTLAYVDRKSKALINIPTYVSANDELVHPSLANFAIHDSDYVMAFTAYTDASTLYENPSIVISKTGYNNWHVPSEVTNPIVPYPNNGSAFNADPNLYTEGDSLYLTYKYAKDAVCRTELKATKDGITWKDTVCIAALSDGFDINYIASQSIVKSGSTYYMYYTSTAGGHQEIKRRSSTNLRGAYADPRIMTGLTPTAGEWWHSSVHIIDGTYWFIGVIGTGGAVSIYVAKSADGLAWTMDALPLTTVTLDAIDLPGVTQYYKSDILNTAKGWKLYFSIYYNNDWYMAIGDMYFVQ